MEFKSTIFAILIVGLVIIAVGNIITGWNTAYNSGVTYDLGNLSQTTELNDYARSYQDKVSPQSSEASTDFETGTYRGAYSIVTGIFKPFRLVFGAGGMIDAVGERMHIPSYITLTVVNMFIFGIIFTIVAIIFRQLRSSV